MEKVKNRDWVKNAALVFLSVLLVLTFFSNTIMNRSLPEVATQNVTSGSIVARVRGTGTPVVTVYETNELWSSLKTLRFEKADGKWLDFVTANHVGRTTEGDYDAIVGPIANDRTIETLNFYFAETTTREIALELLPPQKLKDQCVLKTKRAIEAVCFTGVKKV